MSITIRNLSVNDIITSPAYQRPLDGNRVRKYADNFSVQMLGVPEISARDGNLYALDGQHRLEAAKSAGVNKARCRVHNGLTYEEEVSLYRKMNKERKRLEQIDDFMAAIEEKDPDALCLMDKVTEAGFKIGRGGGVYRIAAVGELWRMYRINESIITESLSVCKVLVEFLDDSSLTGDIIGGVHLVIHNHPHINKKRLQSVLGKHPPRWWTGQADLATNSERRSARMATLIERQYNKGLRTDSTKLPNTIY